MSLYIYIYHVYIYISCIYHVYIMYISCIYHVYISCIYHVNIMYISCIYHVYIIYISCIYHLYIIYISCIYHVYLTYIDFYIYIYIYIHPISFQKFPSPWPLGPSSLTVFLVCLESESRDARTAISPGWNPKIQILEENPIGKKIVISMKSGYPSNSINAITPGSSFCTMGQWGSCLIRLVEVGSQLNKVGYQRQTLGWSSCVCCRHTFQQQIVYVELPTHGG